MHHIIAILNLNVELTLVVLIIVIATTSAPEIQGGKITQNHIAIVAVWQTQTVCVRCVGCGNINMPNVKINRRAERHEREERTMRKKLATFCAVGCIFLLSGCSIEGQLPEGEQNKLMVCKDFRDGETFSFNTNTITDIRVGIGSPTTFKIITISGEVKTLSSSMEAYLKCKEKR